ncbi:hypothetical protein AALC17_18870 [Oscillospiraceae bacterium 38-13]
MQQIKDKTKERKKLLAEKKATMLYQPKKLYDLSRRITKLTEELKELIAEKEMLLHTLDSTDDADISELKKTIAVMESTLKKLEEQAAKYSAELDATMTEYSELKEQAPEFDADELMDARLSIRADREHSAIVRVQSAYGEKYDPLMMHDSKRDVADLLNGEVKAHSVREFLRQKQEQQVHQIQKELKRHKQER